MTSRRGGGRFPGVAWRAVYFGIRKTGTAAILDSATRRGEHACSHVEVDFGIRNQHEDRRAGPSQLRRFPPPTPRRSWCAATTCARSSSGTSRFTDHVWLLVTGELPTAGAAPRARCDAGRDRRARARAERPGEPHDARRGARGAAGRRRGGHPRLRLGDPRLGRVGRAPVRRRARARRPRRALECGGAMPCCEKYARRERAIPGYGHPLHKGDDPRVARLLEIADRGGLLAGRHIEAAQRHRARCCPRSPASRSR